jgi:hypothetical protein
VRAGESLLGRYYGCKRVRASGEVTLGAKEPLADSASCVFGFGTRLTSNQEPMWDLPAFPHRLMIGWRGGPS